MPRSPARGVGVEAGFVNSAIPLNNYDILKSKTAMKIALIQPENFQHNYRGAGLVDILCEPIGICYVSEYLKKQGHDSHVFHQVCSDEKLVTRVTEFAPDIIGFSTMTYNFNQGRKIARALRKKLPAALVVFGGYHASALPAEIIKYPEIDIVIKGQGAETLNNLVNAIEKKIDLAKIGGIIYKKKGKLIKNDNLVTGECFKSLPFPQRDDLDMSVYKQYVMTIPPISKQKAARIHTSVGCAYNKCIFCSTKNIYPKGRIQRNVEDIITELEYLQNKFGINVVMFGDEDFFADQNRIRQLFNRIEEEKLDQKMVLRSFCRATDVISGKKLFQQIKKQGYTTTIMGFESANNDTLKRIGKGLTFQEITEALKLLDEIGIITKVTVMIGYPWETENDLQNTLTKLRELPIDDVYLVYFTPFPGTPLYKQYEATLLTKNFNLFDSNHPVLKTPIKTKKIEKMRTDFLKSFYSSPKFENRLLAKFKRASQSDQELNLWKEAWQERKKNLIP